MSRLYRTTAMFIDGEKAETLGMDTDSVECPVTLDFEGVRLIRSLVEKEQVSTEFAVIEWVHDAGIVVHCSYETVDKLWRAYRTGADSMIYTTN